NKIHEIDRQLQTEVNAIKDSLKASYESTQAQEQIMTQRVAELKKDVLDLQKRSIQYNILKREVDTNRDLYTSLLQRYKEVAIGSGVAASNVFVIDKAGPGWRSSRNLTSALLRALAMGFGIAFAVAYGLEILDNKIRTPEQVEQLI